MITGRLKAARNALNMSQTDASLSTGIPVGTLREYEQGPSLPGFKAMQGFVKIGINANWLLTGEGQMLVADMKPEQSYAIDFQCLKKSVQAVEEGLSGSTRRIDPAKKAELILAVYDLFQEPSVSKENVLKLVRLAA